jgi:hypothetical protein
MVALSDQVIIDDQLLLAMYELELSAGTSPDYPPWSPGCAVIDNIPRPTPKCLTGDGNCWAREESLCRVGPLRVYSRSPPARSLA